MIKLILIIGIVCFVGAMYIISTEVKTDREIKMYNQYKELQKDYAELLKAKKQTEKDLADIREYMEGRDLRDM